MTTYDDALTLLTRVDVAIDTNVVFVARPVATLMVASQSTGSVLPKVTTTLLPVEIITGILPKVTTTLVPVQTIVSGTKVGSVVTTLVPVQTIVSRMNKGTLTTYLYPVEIIDTDSSVLSDAEEQSIAIELDITFVDSGTFRNIIESTLVPVEGITGYTTPTRNIDDILYVVEDVDLTNYPSNDYDLELSTIYLLRMLR